MIVKLVMRNKVTYKLETEDLTNSYIDFRSYMITTDILLFIDLGLYVMLILVLVNVIFSWLPQVFG